MQGISPEIGGKDGEGLEWRKEGTQFLPQLCGPAGHDSNMIHESLSFPTGPSSWGNRGTRQLVSLRLSESLWMVQLRAHAPTA